ncbi:MAG: hypothetical protein ACOYXA_14140 [Bacteroidota bacterium]
MMNAYVHDAGGSALTIIAYVHNTGGSALTIIAYVRHAGGSALTINAYENDAGNCVLTMNACVARSSLFRIRNPCYLLFAIANGEQLRIERTQVLT